MKSKNIELSPFFREGNNKPAPKPFFSPLLVEENGRYSKASGSKLPYNNRTSRPYISKAQLPARRGGSKDEQTNINTRSRLYGACDSFETQNLLLNSFEENGKIRSCYLRYHSLIQLEILDSWKIVCLVFGSICCTCLLIYIHSFIKFHTETFRSNHYQIGDLKLSSNVIVELSPYFVLESKVDTSDPSKHLPVSQTSYEVFISSRNNTELYKYIVPSTIHVTNNRLVPDFLYPLLHYFPSANPSLSPPYNIDLLVTSNSLLSNSWHIKKAKSSAYVAHSLRHFSLRYGILSNLELLSCAAVVFSLLFVFISRVRIFYSQMKENLVGSIGSKMAISKEYSIWYFILPEQYYSVLMLVCLMLLLNPIGCCQQLASLLYPSYFATFASSITLRVLINVSRSIGIIGKLIVIHIPQ
jgi:hypothetical protein